MTNTILDKIVKQKKSEIKQLKKKSIPKIKKSKSNVFYNGISKPGLNLIAELKKASPSAGIIRQSFDYMNIAKQFIQSGASALSILTDEKFFLGNKSYLEAVSKSTTIPILRKDFILDPLQVYESSYIGADAILLILSILSLKQAQELINCAKELNLDVLVEVHDEAELDILMNLKNVKIIGFNNRNLKTFNVDINHCLKMKQILENTHLNQCVFVSESGYNSINELNNLLNYNFNSVLIGEGLAKNKQLADYFKK